MIGECSSLINTTITASGGTGWQGVRDLGNAKDAKLGEWRRYCCKFDLSRGGGGGGGEGG